MGKGEKREGEEVKEVKEGKIEFAGRIWRRRFLRSGRLDVEHLSENPRNERN